MRTAFYLFISLLLASPMAFADEAPVQPAVEEVPVHSKGSHSSEKSSQVKATLPASSASRVQAPSSSATDIISAKGEKLAIATGHYARARALLIASLREFDKGLELVDPNALVDTAMWRGNVMDRADDLAHILDPQPRKSRGGVRFDDATAKTGDAGARQQKK
jgi:hypothetical protein